MFSPMPDNYNIIILLTYFQLYLKLRKIIKTFVFFLYFFNTFIIFDYYIHYSSYTLLYIIIKTYYFI